MVLAHYQYKEIYCILSCASISRLLSSMGPTRWPPPSSGPWTVRFWPRRQLSQRDLFRETPTRSATRTPSAYVETSSAVFILLNVKLLFGGWKSRSCQVTSPGNSAPPTICGSNSGDHSKCLELSHSYSHLQHRLYVQNNVPSVCRLLCKLQRFKLRDWNSDLHSIQILEHQGKYKMAAFSNKVSVTGAWNDVLYYNNIYHQVTQYSCNFENLAPDGCTQYYYGSSANVVQSFNYDGSHHLANQNQQICVRQAFYEVSDITSSCLTA